MGKFFDKKLEELGATRVFDIFLGDTSQDLEREFAEWKSKLWPSLISHYTSINKTNEVREKVAPVKKSLYPLKIIEAGDKIIDNQIQPLCIRQYVHGKDIKIHSMRELRQTSKYGSCLEIIYSLKDDSSPDSEQKFKYETASNLAVFPENDESDINRICKRLNLDKEFKFVFSNEERDKEVRKHPFPTPCTIGDALRKYSDLRGPLDRNTFKHLSEFAIDESEKSELIKLSSNDVKEDIELMKNNFTNIMDILDNFPSINMTGDVFLQFVPKMMPRYYTIASSSKLSPNKVRIAISLTVHQNENGDYFMGLTSQYFNRIFKTYFNEESKESVTSRIFFKESLFKIPESSKTPLIMVGPGTGVVPFIAFSEEREYLKQQNSSKEFGEAHLYFGCKGQNDDYIYKNEIAKFKTDGFITHLNEAFSRDQKTKVYVQDLMLQNKDKLRDLILNHNAHIYMCGSMDMGKAVEKLLEETVIGDPAAWKALKDEKRYAKELWSA